MKYLKIENSKGYFYRTHDSFNEWVEIDKINKMDMWNLLHAAIREDFEMDAFIEANIANKAHQIVYKNIHEKFNELLTNKTQFVDECDAKYKEALLKYSQSTDEQQ